MSNEILTAEQVGELYQDWRCFFKDNPGSAALCIRAIEQAILQSPEVQAWKRDAERYRATRAGLVGTDPDYGSRFCKYCDENSIDQAKIISEEQFDAATDAAMESKT